MKEITLIALGLLIGWLIEWVIDWFYWRRKYRNCQEENSKLLAQVSLMKEELASRSSRTVSKSDDFTLIGGVGPVISKMLNDAGINTFEKLGATSSKELKVLLGDLIERLSDEEDLLRQAKRFAKEKKLARDAQRKKKVKKEKKSQKASRNKKPAKDTTDSPGSRVKDEL